MNYYQQTLEKAKQLIQTSSLSSEDKTFLMEIVPRLSLDMLEVFVWTIEEDSSSTSAIVEKTRRLISTATDPDEMKKAMDADKKEMERLLAEDEASKTENEPV